MQLIAAAAETREVWTEAGNKLSEFLHLAYESELLCEPSRVGRYLDWLDLSLISLATSSFYSKLAHNYFSLAFQFSATFLAIFSQF